MPSIKRDKKKITALHKIQSQYQHFKSIEKLFNSLPFYYYITKTGNKDFTSTDTSHVEHPREAQNFENYFEN
jgi:hypothetical protein